MTLKDKMSNSVVSSKIEKGAVAGAGNGEQQEFGFFELF